MKALVYTVNREMTYRDEPPSRTVIAASRTAIGRNGHLDDLAGAAIFLCAPASDYITGQVLYVDGGFTAK